MPFTEKKIFSSWMGLSSIFGSYMISWINYTNMDKSYFLKLLRKYLQGNAKNEECQFLVSYYNLFESEPDVIALLSEEQKEDLKNQMKAAIWQSITAHEQQDKKVKPIYRSWIAAAVFLVICSAGIAYLFNQSPQQKTTVAQFDQQKEHRLISFPDGSKVIESAGNALNHPSSFDGFDKRDLFIAMINRPSSLNHPSSFDGFDKRELFIAIINKKIL